MDEKLQQKPRDKRKVVFRTKKKCIFHLMRKGGHYSSPTWFRGLTCVCGVLICQRGTAGISELGKKDLLTSSFSSFYYC